jgi:hypothetical protein
MTRNASQDSPALTPAAFLVRGLAAGVVAGLLAFAVAFAFGEPYVDDAIALEASSAAAEPASDDGAEEGTVVSRTDQKSWGLLTGTLALGTALGGLTALAAAAVVGRLGALSARGATALVSLLGFVSISLVPFWKYPATPPAVGSGETIGGRTASYFAFLLVSVLAVIAAVVLARRLAQRLEPYAAAMVAAGGYLLVVLAAGLLLPSVNEVGDFPADTLWHFRRASIATLAALWAGLGVVLVLLVGRLHDRVTAVAVRRELAQSL